MYSENLTYEELLDDERWHALRRRILQRDKHKCQICGAQDNLNVHHRYYIFAHDPWEYYDHALITLCQACHKMVHDTLPPIVYAQNGNVLKPMKFTPCSRCGGYGYIPEYNYVRRGICFRCKGLKFEELINYKPTDSYDKYIDQLSDVFDSVNPLDAVEAEKIFQKGLALHKENPRGAKKYYLLAAKSGSGKAQNNLGLLLEDEGNIENAKRWMLYSAMQGIYQGKSNITHILMKTDKNNPAFNHWFDIMSEYKDFQCKIAFEAFVDYLKKVYEENYAPSIKNFIMPMELLVKLAAEGHDLSKRLVKKHQIDIILKTFQDKIASGYFEEEH